MLAVSAGVTLVEQLGELEARMGTASAQQPKQVDYLVSVTVKIFDGIRSQSLLTAMERMVTVVSAIAKRLDQDSLQTSVISMLGLIDELYSCVTDLSLHHAEGAIGDILNRTVWACLEAHHACLYEGQVMRVVYTDTNTITVDFDTA